MLTNEEDYTVSIPKRIEALVIDDDLLYMDAVIQTSDEMGVEPGFVAKYLTKPIVERIQSEAEDKNLLPKTAKLPF